MLRERGSSVEVIFQAIPDERDKISGSIRAVSRGQSY